MRAEEARSAGFLQASARALRLHSVVALGPDDALAVYVLPTRRYPPHCYHADGTDALTVDARRSGDGWVVAGMRRQPC